MHSLRLNTFSQTDGYLQSCIHKYTAHCGPCWDSHAKVTAEVHEGDVHPAHSCGCSGSSHPETRGAW